MVLPDFVMTDAVPNTYVEVYGRLRSRLCHRPVDLDHVSVMVVHPVKRIRPCANDSHSRTPPAHWPVGQTRPANASCDWRFPGPAT